MSGLPMRLSPHQLATIRQCQEKYRDSTDQDVRDFMLIMDTLVDHAAAGDEMHAHLAAENARLERELADVRVKSSARKLALRDTNAKVQRLEATLARLQGELKEARELMREPDEDISYGEGVSLCHYSSDETREKVEAHIAALSRSEEGR